MLIGEKRNDNVKGRCILNGKATRGFFTKEETTSPTTSLEGISMTAVIDAKEKHDMLSAGIPNTFIQATRSTEEGGKIIMKVTG